MELYLRLHNGSERMVVIGLIGPPPSTRPQTSTPIGDKGQAAVQPPGRASPSDINRERPSLVRLPRPLLRSARQAGRGSRRGGGPWQRRRHLHPPAGVRRGKDGIRQAFTKLLGEVPQATWGIKTTIYEDDILFLEWGAEGGGNRIEDGIDTFVFHDGLIRVQTVRYTLQPAR